MKGSSWTKLALLEMSGNYWETCALHTAVKLELLTPSISAWRIRG